MVAKKIEEKRIKEFVKDRYGEIAKKEKATCSCCGTSIFEQAKAIGYSSEELKKIPESAIMGLGCGNPVALADRRLFGRQQGGGKGQGYRCGYDSRDDKKSSGKCKKGWIQKR